MTGNVSAAPGAPATQNAYTATESRPPGWLARLAASQTRYYAVDGGSGAHLLAALAGQSPHLQPAATPRHADTLIVVEPISRKLASAVAEIARALPRPAHALIVQPTDDRALAHLFADQTPASAILSNARSVPADAQALLAAALEPNATPLLTVSDAFPSTEETISLPPSQEHEIATELVVLSLGPLQPFTAGPLRLWLVCDGEQVLSCQVEAGYAARGVAEAMRASDWRAGAALARQLDPLAPIAGQLAYVQALEQLQEAAPTPNPLYARVVAVAVEEAVNHLWWATSFFRLLDAPRLASRAGALAAASANLAARLWPEPPARWLAPQTSAPLANTAVLVEIEHLSDAIGAFTRSVRGNRLLRLRTAGVGQLERRRPIAMNVTGPIIFANMRGAGDVQSRLLARLELAATRFGFAAHISADKVVGQTEQDEPQRHAARWDAPPGDVSVSVNGPRGALGLRLVSDGGERPALVDWRRPSAAALALLPALLAGQKLADAEIIVASLDLAMSEADG